MPKRQLQGTVVSDVNEKTVVVRVDRAFTHPVMKKTVRRSKKYHAHDEANAAKVGDVVCCYGRCLKIGRSSMRLKLEVWVKPVLRANEAQRYCVTEGIFTYVAIDEQGKSRPVPV